MGTGLIILLAVVALVVLVGLWFAATYNKFVNLRNRVANSWAQIEVQLKRRWDLIPNLVETVKGYAKHESGTLEAVIAARNAAAATGGGDVAATAQAENALSGALRQLFAVAEAYPDLKANQNYLQLQGELTETENKISFTRQFYNDTVMTYNIALQVFPAVLIAGMLNFKPEKQFEAEEAERAVPQVSF
jgi:LemA protein